MKILHTSDWHLGVSADQAPRREEHERFLDWLVALLAEREHDVLLIAGDVYHYTQPSARCQQTFYSFLARCAAETSLRQVIVVGGNHDSASRLDAPRDLLDSLDIYVVGGLLGDESTWDRCFCPVYDDDGEVACVFVCVPYVHESRLGVLTTNKPPSEIRRELEERFGHLYIELSKRARARWPEAPLVATAHMTVFARRDLAVDPDYQVPIHFAGLIGALPPTIFGLDYAYVALGHIHELNEVPGSVAWYCGSPVPTCVVETRKPRHVLEVRVNPKKPQRPAVVEQIEVPSWRQNFELIGPYEEVVEQARALQWHGDLPPYLYVELQVDEPMLDGLERLQEVLAASFPEAATRPRVVRFKESLVRREETEYDLSRRAALRLMEMDPEQVFGEMFKWRYEQEPSDEILNAFRTLLHEHGAAED